MLRGLLIAVGVIWLVPTLLLEGTAKVFWFGIWGLDRLYARLEE
jgi:hypothetical protein